MKTTTLGNYLEMLLKAQGESLARLAAFFGEEKLLEMLEDRDEERDGEIFSKTILNKIHKSAEHFEATAQEASLYGALQGAVSEAHLSEPLEFHLWAFAPYRRLVEGSVPLSMPIQDALPDLVEESLRYSTHWLNSLAISSIVFPQAKAGFEPVWVRFRAQMLKSSGLSPFRQV
jgi:hypothetical protein